MRNKLTLVSLLIIIFLGSFSGGYFLFQVLSPFAQQDERKSHVADVNEATPIKPFVRLSIESLPLKREELISPYVLLLRQKDGAILFEKNSNQILYPASLTKMMTVLVVLAEEENLQREVVLPKEIFPKLIEADAALAGFSPGEAVTVQDLLYGAMLSSGAECCESLAISVSGSVEAFVAKMNEKAAAIGMADTQFCNTTGLHDDRQYSTALDLAILLEYALNDPRFEQIFTSEYYLSSSTSYHQGGLEIYNRLLPGLNTLIGADGNVLGSKTGYTSQAGLCLASLGQVKGERYILVTAGAQGNYQSTNHLRDAATVYRALAQSEK